MKKDITELFCNVDDFCREMDKVENAKRIGSRRGPTRVSQMQNSEVLTIQLLFHQSPCKNFKYFFQSYLQLYRSEFPKLVSYNRFLELIPRSFPYFMVLLHALLDKKDNVHFIDSTAIPVCHNKRIWTHKVFKGLARRGKTSMGWFFGFKLHLVINRRGNLAGFAMTPGNVDDRAPVRQLVKDLKGLLFGDRGYIDSNLFRDLYDKGVKLITGIRSNMKNKLVLLNEKIMLRKRSISETVND
jgi:Transposase DDE domain